MVFEIYKQQERITMPRGGRRQGAGRPSLGHRKATYYLPKDTVDQIVQIARTTEDTLSSVAERLMKKGLEQEGFGA